MITDDQVDSWLGILFGGSEPGSAIHHLLVAATAPDMPDEIGVTICAIAPVGDSAAEAETFVTQAVAATIVDMRANKGLTIHFAGLATEDLVVETTVARIHEDARRLQATGSLQTHPDVVEVTRLYAAARDGRRWSGRHVLTGPSAGSKDGPTVRRGPLHPGEHETRRIVIRAAVGLAGLR